MSEIKHVDDSNFDQEVLQTVGQVLVKFGAEWCKPCTMLLPIVEKFATIHTAIKVVSVDVDDSPVIAAKFGIRSLPTLLIFENGKRIGMSVGLTNLKTIEEMFIKVVPSTNDIKK